MNWEASINEVRQHVVRIETPNGHGTVFLAFYNHDATWCGIATAAHVVSHAEEWQQPIKIRNDASARDFGIGQIRMISRDFADVAGPF